MNCVCGCSVFDHAKVYDGVLYQEGWYSQDGEGRYLGLSARHFTLSGRCEAFKKGNTYRECKCPGFKRVYPQVRPANYASALRHLAETPMRILLLCDEAQPVQRNPRIQSTAGRLEPTLSVVRDIYAMPPQPTPEAWAEWWKKYDRPPEPGRTETM